MQDEKYNTTRLHFSELQDRAAHGYVVTNSSVRRLKVPYIFFFFIFQRDLSHLSSHCRACRPDCVPVFERTAILLRHKNQQTREIVEASHIRKAGSECVSHPSIALLNREVAYLDAH